MSDSASQSSGGEPRRIHPRWMLASGNCLFRIRNGLFPLLFVVLMLVTGPANLLNNPAWDRLEIYVGAAIALSGEMFRLFVIGFAYIKRGGKNRKVYANDLVIAGLYAHTRNPMYVGNFLIAVGVSIFYGAPWIYIFAIPFFAWVYLAITAAEEQYLLGKFGPAYEDYMRRVNRFVPDFRSLSKSLAGCRYRWRTVLAKEYGTLFGLLAGLTLITIWKKYWIYGWDAQKHEILTIAWLFVPWILFYVTVRFLKKAKLLKEPVATDSQGSRI